MRFYLNKCDYYFKRSYSTERNKQLFSIEHQAKMHALGLYYIVTTPDNPLNESGVKRIAKIIKGKKPDNYFVHDVFETTPLLHQGKPRIIFFCRLWEETQDICRESNIERQEINDMRIKIIRKLRESYGESFIGGLSNSELAQRLAPDLIVSKKVTDRANYINMMKSCDICIGSMGLHESIGGKTAEYVAASKAIVNEQFHYEVPFFEEGINYLSFVSVEECLEKVDYLIKNPEALYRMKIKNNKFYKQYLKADKLVENSLRTAGVFL